MANTLPLLRHAQVTGTPERAGAAYGEELRYPIQSFLERELKPDAEKLAYARACTPFLEATPIARDWLRGMAKGAKLTADESTLVSLHEENYHGIESPAGDRVEGHCTAFGSSNDGEVLLGQNWDWSIGLLHDRGLLSWTPAHGPSMVAYSYPGLPVCAGLNEEGLGMVWTGAGLLPIVKSKPGIPTYALLQESLTKRTVSEVQQFLVDRRTHNAGCFVLFYADPTGDMMIAEGVPGHIAFERGPSLYRSNIFRIPEIDRLSEQFPLPDDDTALIRERVAARMMIENQYALSEEALRAALHTPPLYRTARTGFSLDSIVVNASTGTLAIASGGEKPGPWAEYRCPTSSSS